MLPDPSSATLNDAQSMRPTRPVIYINSLKVCCAQGMCFCSLPSFPRDSDTTMASPLSAGNAYFTHVPPMRLPSLEFIYRLECAMSTEEQIVGKSSASGTTRAILPIAGGSVRGPTISATILNVAGADWATTLAGDSVSPSQDRRIQQVS